MCGIQVVDSQLKMAESAGGEDARGTKDLAAPGLAVLPLSFSALLFGMAGAYHPGVKVPGLILEIYVCTSCLSVVRTFWFKGFAGQCGKGAVAWARYHHLV